MDAELGIDQRRARKQLADGAAVVVLEDRFGLMHQPLVRYAALKEQ